MALSNSSSQRNLNAQNVLQQSSFGGIYKHQMAKNKNTKTMGNLKSKVT